jgi:hypothetical protein
VQHGVEKVALADGLDRVDPKMKAIVPPETPGTISAAPMATPRTKMPNMARGERMLHPFPWYLVSAVFSWAFCSI